MKPRAGRPLKGKEKRERTSFTLPPQTLTWIDTQAKQLKMSRSDYLVLLSHISPKLSPKELKIFARVSFDQELLKGFCKHYHVSKLSLFGSVLHDHFTQKSDIDVLVEFEPEAKPSLFTLSEMEAKLSQLLKKKIDLRTPAELSKYFRQEVLDEAHLIYAA